MLLKLNVEWLLDANVQLDKLIKVNATINRSMLVHHNADNKVRDRLFSNSHITDGLLIFEERPDSLSSAQCRHDDICIRQ